jgi:elongation factor G
MRVDVETPTEFAGELMSDFSGRRGRNSGMDLKGSTQILHALVPMSEMLTYGNDLISKTQGRASFHMEFDHYDFVPSAQADKIILAAKAHRVHTDEEE